MLTLGYSYLDKAESVPPWTALASRQLLGCHQDTCLGKSLLHDINIPLTVRIAGDASAVCSEHGLVLNTGFLRAV